jgi:ABC-type branched-subunit amino acid transport system ATPase component
VSARSERASPALANSDSTASQLLRVTGLTKVFGGVRAVDDCSFTVGEGSVTGLIGPNGSGKTTVFNIVTGYLHADSGRVEFDGRDVTGRDTGALYRHGLSRTFQQARVFPQMTVLDNLVVAAGYPWWQQFTRRIRAADRDRAGRLLAEFGLAGHADALAAELSYGQRKLLEFAAVLMSSPRLVLLDEPTAGVNPVLVETMERHVRERRDAGVTFLIVEHDLTFVMRLCDPVVVLDAGRPIFTGPPAEVQANPLVLDAYLGG